MEKPILAHGPYETGGRADLAGRWCTDPWDFPHLAELLCPAIGRPVYLRSGLQNTAVGPFNSASYLPMPLLSGFSLGIR